jgi:hypothetical protein
MERRGSPSLPPWRQAMTAKIEDVISLHETD